LEEFTKAYDAFFVDESKSSLKNDKFGDLENLKKLLDKLEGSSDYNAAKTKYEDLVKKVSAIQINSVLQSSKMEFLMQLPKRKVMRPLQKQRQAMKN